MNTRYERPTRIADACRLLAEAESPAFVLAGGTDLMVKVRSRTVHPSLLVDIKAIRGMGDVLWSGDDLRLGAAVTMRQVYEDRPLAATYPALADAAEAVGSLQIRCRATVGGNLCNASPCMDTAPALLVLGARIEIEGPSGGRVLPLQELFVGVKKTSLARGEICSTVVVPEAATRLRTAFGKIKRVRGHDLALVNCAVAWDAEAGTLRAAIGSCCQTPVLTRSLVDASPRHADDAADALAKAAGEVICPIDDVRASAEYRRDMAAYLCRRLVKQVLAPAAGRAA